MLLGRRIGAKALTWQTTRIQSSHQVRLLASYRPSLPKNVENNTRVNTILKVQNAVALTSSKLTLDSLTTDDQRRDYLWSRREQILKILPGREWKKVFAIARRLFEYNYLIRPPPDKEFKKKMLENSGDLLIKFEQTPMWLTAEIKMLEGRDQEDKQETKEGSDMTNLPDTGGPVDKSVPDSLASAKEETSMDQNTASTTNVKASDQVPVIPDTQLFEKALGADAEDVSRYRNLVISPESEPAKTPATPTKKTIEKPITKSSAKPTEKSTEKSTEKAAEKPTDKSAERFLEKKATESAKEREKEISPIQLIFPEYKKVIRTSGREEEATVEKLNQLQMPEDKTTGAFEILQKLSRTLTTENVRPDLKPVFYPNQAAYALLAEATALLEEACFEFVKKRAPSVTAWPTFDCPEAQEYKRWVDLIIKLGKEHSKDGFKLPPKFVEGVGYGDIIRNSAAHRLPIHAPKLRELLRYSRLWIESLDVPEVAQKFERLEQSAADMQTDLENDYSPVVDEIREVLSRIKDRWDNVKQLEDKILEIQRSIRLEMTGIELEEKNMQDSLRKAQGIRYDRGQKFERQGFHDYVHGSLVEANETKAEAEEFPEEWREDEIITEELPVETETDSPAAENGRETPALEIPNITGAALLNRKENRKARQAVEETGRANSNKTKLARDYQGGLVSYEKDALPDIEDISLANSKRPGQKSEKTRSETELPEDLETKSTKAKEMNTEDQKSEEVKRVKDGPLGEQMGSKKTTPSEDESRDPKKAKEISFEGSNLSKDSDIGSLNNDPAKWYNPLSWFR